MLRFILKQLNRNKTIVKFVISGTTAAAAHFLILTVLIEIFGVWYVLSASLGFLTAFMISFNMQKFWAFRDKSRERLAGQMSVFFLTAVTGMLLNAGGMFTLVERFGIHYIPAQVIMGAFIAAGNFLIYRFVIFKKGHEKQAQAAGADKKRLLIATPIWPPVIGGPATYARTLADHLPMKGFSVRVVTYGQTAPKSSLAAPGQADSGKNKANENEITVIEKEQNLVFKYFRFFRAMWKETSRSDHVLALDLVNAGLPACLACYLRQKPFVLKIVGDYAWEHARERHLLDDTPEEFQEKSYNTRIELIRRIQRGVAREAEAVITPSEYLRKIVSGWGIDSAKIKVIYNSVKPAKVEKSREQVRQELNFEGPTIISAGRLLPWKGFYALVDIMPELAKAVPDIRLAIIGEGPEKQRLEKHIADSPVQDRITLFPALEQKRLWQYIRAGDVFVLNTGYEGLSHVLIEALMLGAPVITTPAGGNRELIQDQVNGLIVEYDNKRELVEAIQRVLADQDLKRKLIAGSREGLEKFSQERMIGEVIGLLGRTGNKQ